MEMIDWKWWLVWQYMCLPTQYCNNWVVDKWNYTKEYEEHPEEWTHITFWWWTDFITLLLISLWHISMTTCHQSKPPSSWCTENWSVSFPPIEILALDSQYFIFLHAKKIKLDFFLLVFSDNFFNWNHSVCCRPAAVRVTYLQWHIVTSKSVYCSS